MKKTVVKKLVQPGTENVIGIRVTTDMDKFTIPVVDVRTSEESRRQAESIMKARNIQTGSKFIKPSYSMLGYSYNNSMKK